MIITSDKGYNNYPSDEALLTLYLDGDDEPVGVWIDQKYFPELWVIAQQRLWKNPHYTADTLQDIALQLCEYKMAERPVKFVPIASLVQPALYTRVRHRAIDISRKHRLVFSIEEANESYIPAEIEEYLTIEKEMTMLKAYYETRGYQSDWYVVELIIEYNRKAKAILMNEYRMDEKSAHSLLTKNRRRLRNYGLFLKRKI